MSKTQLILLWIGVALFIFCLWNPKLKPDIRHYWEDREYTDKEWEHALSRYNLSPTESKESLRDKKTSILLKEKERAGRKKTVDFFLRFEREYIEMLLKGERSTKRVKVGWDIHYSRFFKTDASSLLTRLLSVAVIASLVIYTLGGKNRQKVKEIFQPIIRRLKGKPRR